MSENIEKIIVDHRGGSCGCGCDSCGGGNRNSFADMAALMNTNKGIDPMSLMAMMNGQEGGMGGGNSMWWIFILLLFGMGGNGGGLFGNRNNEAAAIPNQINQDANANLLMQAINGNKESIAALANQTNTDNNTNLLMRSIDGNQAAIASLATNLNCDMGRVTDALCSIKGGIDKVAGEIGTTSQHVISEMRLGNCGIQQQLAECCCNTQTTILNQTNQLQNSITQSQFASQQGFQTLGNIAQQGFAATNTATQQGIAGINYALSNGFSSVGFETQRQTQALLENANSNTQRILTQMCDDRTQDLRDKLFELSQSAQTAQILARLPKSCCGCDPCCSGYSYPFAPQGNGATV